MPDRQKTGCLRNKRQNSPVDFRQVTCYNKKDYENLRVGDPDMRNKQKGMVKTCY